MHFPRPSSMHTNESSRHDAIHDLRRGYPDELYGGKRFRRCFSSDHLHRAGVSDRDVVSSRDLMYWIGRRVIADRRASISGSRGHSTTTRRTAPVVRESLDELPTWLHISTNPAAASSPDVCSSSLQITSAQSPGVDRRVHAASCIGRRSPTMTGQVRPCVTPRSAGATRGSPTHAKASSVSSLASTRTRPSARDLSSTPRSLGWLVEGPRAEAGGSRGASMPMTPLQSARARSEARI